jgi:hypothetical protein
MSVSDPTGHPVTGPTTGAALMAKRRAEGGASVRGPRMLATLLVFSVLSGVTFSGLLVRNASDAAFNGKTTNPANAWAAGKVAVTDDDGAAAMFAVTGAKPGDSGVKCITVSYDGTLTVPVKLYATSASGGLRSYLTFTVEMGTGGTFADCSAITSVSTIYGPGLLSSFTSTYSAYASGLTTWSPTGAGQSRTFRLTWSMDDDDLAAGTSAAVTFTWEARS